MIQEIAMRDVVINHVYSRMCNEDNVFFITADFGAPTLDKIRAEYPDRFINVGIAEQNLISISSGLALEGFTTYVYAIGSFLTMRAFEQIRISISLLSSFREIDVNLIGVGAGISYDVSGPTHHCLEDISLMRLLPGIHVYSPSDSQITKKILEAGDNLKIPKYFRLDAKPLPLIKERSEPISVDKGFSVLNKGKNVCIIATGYMTHISVAALNDLKDKGIHVGLIDMFCLKPINEESLIAELRKYKFIVTVEEAFIGKAGLDSIILNILNKYSLMINIKSLGFSDSYNFEMGGRDQLHKINGIDKNALVGVIESYCRSEI